MVGHHWTHLAYAVPPERLPLVEACIDALFPWTKLASKPDLLAYSLGADPRACALYVRPVPAAAALDDALRRLRGTDAALATALARLETIEPDWSAHASFVVATLAEWEERLARAGRLERERPELRITVVGVRRPGEGRAPGEQTHQAFIRLGLLGPLVTTFAMQAPRD